MHGFRRLTSWLIALGLGVSFAAPGATTGAMSPSQSAPQTAGVILPAAPVEPAGRSVVNLTELAAQAALEPAPAGVAPRAVHSPLTRPDVVDPSAGVTPRTWTPPSAPRQPAVPSPSPSINFAALDDSGIVIPPDTHGAAGPTRLMTTLNDNYRVQDRTGTAISTVSIGTFWAATGATGVFDPRVLYDPYNDRWIVTAVSNAATASSSLLIGVSQTGNPAGSFSLFRFDVDAADASWADFPTVGFNKNWIVVTVNMFDNTTFAFAGGHVYAMDYPSARSGVSNTTRVTSGGATIQPALTYSATENTLYMVEHLSSGSATYRHYTVTGTPGSPAVTQFSSKLNTLGGWAVPIGDILPQSGTTADIDVGDARISNVIFRNDAVWYTQTIGLPVGVTPQRTAVQWVQLDTLGNFVQGGRIQDPTATSTNGGFWYAYPSIAVNASNDVLIGFSRFSSATFASAAYAFRAAGDTAGTQRDPVIYRAGDATYVKTFSGSRNRWGDYSMTSVDPVDDTSFWTIQEYARPPVGTGATSSRWGTWWARVVSVSAGNTPPTISDIVDQTTPEDTPVGPVAFTIGDGETAAASLALSVSSSDTLLVPSSNLTFGGSGANRTITVAPAANLSGVTTVTVTVTDGGSATAQDTFTVTVTAVNDPPTLNPIADPPVIVEDAGTQAVNLSGIGAGGGESQPLQVTATSSNPGVVPDPTVTYSSPSSTGSLTYTPLANQNGSATVTVTVTDGGLDGSLVTPADNGSLSRTFAVAVTVVNDPPTISAIADQVVAEDVVVGPLAFTVGDVDDGVDALALSGSSSNQAVVPNANITFGGSGASRTVTVTPAANQTGIASITVGVTDAGGATAQDTFLVTVGSLEDNPTLSDIADRSTPEDTATGPIAFAVGDVETPAAALVVTAASSNLSLVPLSGVVFGGAGAARTITVTPAANQAGVALITLTVTDEAGLTAQDTFFLTVTAVNDAPTIGDIPNQTTGLNTAVGPVAFAVDDIDHAPGTLVLTASSSNPTLVPNANVTFGGSGTNRTVTVAPATNLSGSSVISVTVTDPAGGAVQDSFMVTVTDPGTTPPTISDITDVTTPEDTVAGPLAFTVGDAETAAGSLTVTGASSNSSLLSNAGIVFGGSGASRTVTVTPVANASGTTTVSVVVTDGNGATGYDTFTVTVSPVNDPPVIGDIGDRTITKDSSTAAAFPVSDVETAAGSLTLTGSSSNTTLVANASIVFAGGGGSRTVTVTPAAGQTGAATITVTVSDGVLSASDPFVLTVAEPGPVLLTITTPTGNPLTTATSPFLVVGGTAASNAPITSVNWATDRGFSGGGTLQGPVADAEGDSRTWRAEVPLAAGGNFITVTATDGLAMVGTDTLTVTVGSFVYSFAEGATGPFFDLDLAIANPNLAAAPVDIQYLKDDGTTVAQSFTITPRSRTTVRVDGLGGLASAAVSPVVTSSAALPFAVERTMTWDGTGYGAHTEKATPGAHTTWYFAEGSEQGSFDTYLLLANPQAAANRATVRFLVEGGGPVTKVYDLPPTSRTTVFTESVTDGAGTNVLLDKAFGLVVTFDQPGVAERAMYFGTSPLWTGGHESAGVNEPSSTWFHAEGAVGEFFDTFLLLSNPNATDAVATLTLLRDTGETKTITRLVPAESRATVYVNAEIPGVVNAGVATQVSATLPIVSERAMYWAAFPNWYEAHGSFGMTSLATRWALGEGRVGGPAAHETYILLANPGSAAASVMVTFLREGGLQPIVRTYTVPATSRFNVYANAPDIGLVSGERFGALIESSAPIAVERAVYSNSTSQPGIVWAAGTNATGTRVP